MLAAHEAARHPYGDSSLSRRDYSTRPSSVENGSSNLHMARDNKFKPTESIFTKDRDDCRALCAKLNSAITEGSGLEEIRRRFQSIVQPAGRGPASPSSSAPKTGEVGKNVSVDAPFRADYGYNLNIGDNVFIEGGCVFKDPAPIYIGAHTRIGTNVVISGEYMMADPGWHEWSRKVTVRIGKNCVIGTGCIISAPDKTELVIGDDVYIAPGQIITHDIPSRSRVPAQPYDDHHSLRPM
jgi:acetyltransferase-like isoleucine patch superfamily enzyme